MWHFFGCFYKHCYMVYDKKTYIKNRNGRIYFCCKFLCDILTFLLQKHHDINIKNKSIDM